VILNTNSQVKSTNLKLDLSLINITTLIISMR